MGHMNDIQKKVRIILSSSFAEKESLKVGDKWKNETMRRIRSLPPLGPSQRLSFLLEQLFLRFSTVVVLTLIIGLSYMEVRSEYEIHQVLLEEPFDEFLDGFEGIDI